MDLRDLPEQLSSFQRINQRRTLIERELKTDLTSVTPLESVIGEAEKKNCEQMFGVVPIPVGYAGPLTVTFSSGQKSEVHLPLATTEGALVASVNRGCTAASAGGIVITRCVHHGITRSVAFSLKDPNPLISNIRSHEREWKAAAEQTSGHLKVLGYDIDMSKQYVFLTVAFDTDEAMGMNMATIASQAIADWLVAHTEGTECVTIAGNIDSDKKPSRRTHERGRGFEVVCSADVSRATIETILKTTPEAMARVADAKLRVGSSLAGSIGANLHAANIIAALYLATGQDPAHVVEGSLADTSVELMSVAAKGQPASGLRISVRLPAIIVGIRGGGTDLPAQTQCRSLLLGKKNGLKSKQQLAETVGAAVLAGELSLLAAQASHQLASSHKNLGRITP